MIFRRLLKPLKALHKSIKSLFKKSPVVPTLYLGGIIGQTGTLRKNGLTLRDLEDKIVAAFSDKAKAVALIINSPGGSPVQSDLIAARIRNLSAEKNIPVYAFCEDAAASGGFWLACAADEIYARPSSIIGSIGVIYSGFGFPSMLEKIGVERRIYTAGTSKSQLDPFSPEKKADITHIKQIQGDIHQNFIAYVKERRGDRLQTETTDLFNGSFWTGTKAMELGLVDGIDDYNSFLRKKFGEKVKIPILTQKKGFVERYFAKARPIDIVADSLDLLNEKIEHKNLWARLGL